MRDSIEEWQIQIVGMGTRLGLASSEKGQAESVMIGIVEKPLAAKDLCSGACCEIPVQSPQDHRKNSDKSGTEFVPAVCSQ